MNKQSFTLKQSNPKRGEVLAYAKSYIDQRDGDFVIEVKELTRTLEQNSLLWSVLGQVSKQKLWLVDGEHKHLSSEEWKDIFTAGLNKHQRVAKGIDGGFVILGSSTSKMTKKEMSDLLELALAFCAENEIILKDEGSA